ncbi:hypothetical protein EI427_19650 [Flammeovirga pectinis]|uniref:RagB/SusD family nutrient uptake outer membrane protein n=1 Tax=Flammeovirga pectinis TaxID=2494373 RepID=A0A3Q9FQW6_9BACT|nr:SusD/RagB family nutrient-binding outer membrane lipoprotein [Flammeovirga pectinis]AZQ64346.1 hypothetical protein EI427_19650 [Flammeovirga pectinis]
MKNILKSVLLATAIAGTSMSCAKLVEGENVSPNSPTSAPAEIVMPSSQLALAFVNEGDIARIAGMWSGYFTGSDRQYTALNNYLTVATDYDSSWDNLYREAIANAINALNGAIENNNRVLQGYCKVVIANSLGLATNLWGDVPASQISDIENYPMPVFDSQADVYNYVQTLLDEAIADIESGQGGVSQDLLNVNVKALYTLKARYYMHVKDYSMALSNANKGITDTSEDMFISHGTSPYIDANTYWMFVAYERAGYMTANEAFAVDYIKGRTNAKTNMAHIWNYLYTEVTDEVTGDITGYNLNTSGFFAQDRAFPLTTLQETQLIKAEAAARTNDLAVSLTAINEYRAYMNSGGYIAPEFQVLGDEDNPIVMQYDPYVEADFQSGGLLNDGSLAEDKAYLKEVLAARYTTLVGLLEGFSDVRRTYNESEVRVPVTPTVGAKLPQRLLYPQIEVNTNQNLVEVVDLFTPTPVNQ